MDFIVKDHERLDPVSEGIKLIQDKNGFSYGTDSVLLAAFVKRGGGKYVELGAGNGIVSLLLEKRRGIKKITAIEVQDRAFDLLERNVLCNQSDIVPLKKDVREVSQSDVGGDAAVVFANPPYMKCDSGFLNSDESKKAARHEIFGGIDDFVSCASRLLKTGGVFCCVYRPDRLSELFHALKTNRLEPKKLISVHPEIQKRSNLVLVEAKKDAKPGMLLTRPLIIKERSADGAPRYSADYEQIYGECEFDDSFNISR